MKRYLTEAENRLSDNVNGQDIGLWVDGSDHMQFKCNKCNHMMNLLTAPIITKYKRQGGTIYFNIFCRTCNTIHGRKIYFGLAANDMIDSVEYQLNKTVKT